jgi:hypothetical protein
MLYAGVVNIELAPSSGGFGIVRPRQQRRVTPPEPCGHADADNR